MPSRCWILGCPSNVDRSNTKFFKFPQDEKLKQLWVDSIKRDVAPTDFSRVCSKHFKPEDVITAESSIGSLPLRLRLKDGAVPCIFEGLMPRKERKKPSPKSSLSPKESKDIKVKRPSGKRPKKRKFRGNKFISIKGRRRCSIIGCKSNHSKEDVCTTVFKFPSDPGKRMLWIEKINQKNLKPGSLIGICIKHFEESYILRENKATEDAGTELVLPKAVLSLTADAVPSIFENIPPSNSKLLTPKKKLVLKKKRNVSERKEKAIEPEFENETIVKESFVKESMTKTEVLNNDVQNPKVKRPSGKRPKKRKFRGNKFISIKGRRCSIIGCKSNHSKEDVCTTVFKFPSDPGKRMLWIEKINRKNLKPGSLIGICIKHFEESYILFKNKATKDAGTELVLPKAVLSLTADAVPSIFENIPPSNSKLLTPKKKLVLKKKKNISERKEKAIEPEFENETIVKESFVEESMTKTKVLNNDVPIIRRKCSVLGCRNNDFKEDCYATVFPFPSDPDKRKLWLEKINRENFKGGPSTGICIKHFEESCILRENKAAGDDGPELVLPMDKLSLTADAVPSLFESPLQSNSKTPTLKKKRVVKKKKDVKENEEKCIDPELEKEIIANESSADESMTKTEEILNKDVQSDKEEKVAPPTVSDLNSSATEIEKSIDTSQTTDKPIITILKAQAEAEKPESDDEEIIPLEQLKSPIIKSHMKKIPNDLPSPYKHLPNVSVCLKEEDRIILTQDESKSLKRSSSASSSSNSVSENAKSSPLPKRRKVEKPAPLVIGRQNDAYCWVCHRENIVLSCIACPRAYHLKCAGEASELSDWVCFECRRILTAENVDTRSSVLSEISLDKLCALLRFCLNKMKHRAGAPFHQPVSLEHYPMYLHYVIHPMDFSLLEKNIKQKLYGCTEAFLADVKWILHNSCVFNGSQHPLSSNARALVKTCETDMQEIEVCPDCFMHSVIRNKYWFADVCRKPHPLVWAKLKGFPYWPAKVVRILDGNVDARFFGAHDRAWVPISQCYHLSKETPTTSKPKKKGNYETALDELNVHVQLLIQKFGTFDYAQPRTVFDPKNKKLMYHGVDIDKVNKEEIPFDPSTANNKEFCPSPTDERRMSFDSKMDIDPCEEASSNSLLSTADVRIPRIISCDEEKGNLDSSKDKVENKIQEPENAKQIDLTLEDTSKSQTTSNVPRDKLEMALERIKGYVSLDAEEEKENSNKEDEPEKSEPVKKTSISSEGTSIILANLIKSKNLPKIDLPDISAVEEDTTKEKESFLDMSKKNDTFTLHLLETIKKAKSRAAADDEEEDSDMETDEEDSDSDSVVDEENENGKEAVEENESDEHEDEDKEIVETVSASDEDTESESGNESSSESSDTDIEEISDGPSAVSKSVEQKSGNAKNDQSKQIDNETAVNSVKTKDSDIITSPSDPREFSADTNKNTGAKSTESSLKKQRMAKSLEIGNVNTLCNKTLDAQNVEESDKMTELDNLVQNRDEAKEDVDMEDDEVIICPPVKPPTPPLICLDDGTETESDNDSNNKDADAQKTLLEKDGNASFFQAADRTEKPSVVRYLTFNGNEISLTAEKPLSSPKDIQGRGRHNNKRPRISVSSSDDESSDDGLVIDKTTGVPLRGARRTFNSFKNRSISSSKPTSAAKDPAVQEFLADSLEFRLDDRRNSVDNSLKKDQRETVSSMNEPGISVEQSALSDGSNHEISPDKGPLDEKDLEIMRLKKKFATLFTAFRLQHWKNTQEKLELKHNMNLIIMEMRASLEADKKQAIETLSRTFERFKQKAIDEVKRNQWCAFCLKEARYQCCWNTNYCSVTCQKRNFPMHKKNCTQVKNKSNPTVISDSTSATNEPKENKKVFVVNMVPKNDATHIQIVPSSSNVSVFSTSSTSTVVPSTNVQYILAQSTAKTSDSTTTHQVSNQEEKQETMDSSEIIKNVRSGNCDLSTAISLFNKKNLETVSSSHTKEKKTDEPDLEEIYFPSPPQVSFEGLESANADESIKIIQAESLEKNSSDTEILGQEDKKGESSAEEDINFSDNDEADNEQVSIGNGVEVKAKFLNKCLIYGKTAKRLTRCLVDVLFPDLKQLATCSAFGQKSNVTKTTRAALPGKMVYAIIEFVQKRFPAATRTEIVLAINLKCKEARNIVDKQDGEKPVKRNLFRRLLARDQSLEVNKTATTTASYSGVPITSSSISSLKPKAPIMVMRQPPTNQTICIKAPQLPVPLSSEGTISPTKTVHTPNILRCSPQLLVRPKFAQPGDSPSSQPRLSQKTIRTLLPSPQPIGIAPKPSEPKKFLLPLEAYKQSNSPQVSAGTNPRPYIILGTTSSAAPQSLSITQPTSLPSSLLRK